MAKKKHQFVTGDLVTHANRGNGVFVSYRMGRTNCFVRFVENGDYGDAEEVTTALVQPRVLAPKPVKCKHCKKVKGEHHARTLGCPVGRPGRIGHCHFSQTQFFTPKS